MNRICANVVPFPSPRQQQQQQISATLSHFSLFHSLNSAFLTENFPILENQNFALVALFLFDAFHYYFLVISTFRVGSGVLEFFKFWASGSRQEAENRANHHHSLLSTILKIFHPRFCCCCCLSRRTYHLPTRNSKLKPFPAVDDSARFVSTMEINFVEIFSVLIFNLYLNLLYRWYLFRKNIRWRLLVSVEKELLINMASWQNGRVETQKCQNDGS